MREPRILVWPRLPPAAIVRSPRGDLPFPLGEPTCRLVALARHGLWRGVQDAGLEPGDEVLTPAYSCGAEVEALIRAGLVCRFYDATTTLEPAEDELEDLITPRTRALFLIHYLGFPQDAVRWRSWCDRHELVLIEDCAPAWLASRDGAPVGSQADVAIFSLYKTLPVPDGGAVITARSVSGTAAPGPAGITATAKLAVQWLMGRWGRLDGLLARREVTEVPTDFAMGDPDVGPSKATRFLLPRLARDPIKERRRRNYRVLLESSGARVPPPFAELVPGANPLVFPVQVEGDPCLRERLERAGVRPRPVWPTPHPMLPASRFPAAAAWRQRFLAVPVHQELRETDLQRIITALRGSPRPRAGRS